MSEATKNGTRSAFGYAADSDEFTWHAPGLTKREYIAIQAMAALIRAEQEDDDGTDEGDIVQGASEMAAEWLAKNAFYASLMAKAAVVYADALLNELAASQNDLTNEGGSDD